MVYCIAFSTYTVEQDKAKNKLKIVLEKIRIIKCGTSKYVTNKLHALAKIYRKQIHSVEPKILHKLKVCCGTHQFSTLTCTKGHKYMYWGLRSTYSVADTNVFEPLLPIINI